MSTLLILLLLPPLYSFARRVFGVKQAEFGEVDMITAQNINEFKISDEDSMRESKLSENPDLEPVKEEA